MFNTIGIGGDLGLGYGGGGSADLGLGFGGGADIGTIKYKAVFKRI